MRRLGAWRRIAFPPRRRFLGSGLCWLIGVRAPGAAEIDGNAVKHTQSAIQELFGDLVNVKALGGMYLQDHPDEPRSADLLCRGLGLASFTALDAPGLRRRIARRRAADFAAADVVILDGWVFARSEARLFALAALA